MKDRSGRRARTGNTAVDPDKFIDIDRPSDATLHWTAVVCLVLAAGAGAIAAGCLIALVDPAEDITYLIVALIGAALAATLEGRVALRNGRRRREDFVRCGGDPTGMTDMMFGAMRGFRDADGKWVVPAQGSGDYV